MSARSSVPRPVERLVTLASRAGAVAVVLCAAVACGSDAPPAYLTDLVDTAPTDCPAGGRRVVVGPDRDADGVLDADEVAKSTVICNGAAGEVGAPGLGALVVTSTEAPGARCAAGGVRIDVGIDDDRDGALDPEEIDRTAYVCDGADGAPGLSALVATATDPTVASDDNLFVVELVGVGAPTAPTQVNGPLPALADVFSGYRVRADGVIVIYRADEALNDDNELWAVNISETGTPCPAIRVNAPVVSAGDVTSLALEP
jgi:hypothetical protein